MDHSQMTKNERGYNTRVNFPPPKPALLRLRALIVPGAERDGAAGDSSSERLKKPVRICLLRLGCEPLLDQLGRPHEAVSIRRDTQYRGRADADAPPQAMSGKHGRGAGA